ncbi:MAG: hypothetical protein NTZ69_15365 [Bacteroidia bacterium]|nr:hypothetical protein [Bacteroidia bacterium]
MEIKSKPKIKGLIGYHGLIDWWLTEFNENERDHIEETYTPMGSGSYILIKANIESSSSSVIHFLSYLAGWFDNKRDRRLAIKILEKAEEYITDEIPIFDIHIFYHHIIQINYRNRLENPKSFDKAIWGCKQQIKIGAQVSEAFKVDSHDGFMPRHTGYEQLAIIREKEMQYQEVIEICNKAKSEGWRGDWDKRIERCEGKIKKQVGSF